MRVQKTVQQVAVGGDECDGCKVDDVKILVWSDQAGHDQT